MAEQKMDSVHSLETSELETVSGGAIMHDITGKQQEQADKFRSQEHADKFRSQEQADKLRNSEESIK